MRGTGRLMRVEIPKIWGPGRHRAGDNTFTYFRDPNGNTMEYTTELEQLDEDVWHPSIFSTEDPETSDQWGTANPMNEWVTSQVVNGRVIADVPFNPLGTAAYPGGSRRTPSGRPPRARAQPAIQPADPDQVEGKE
jgi:hypothetical protein